MKCPTCKIIEMLVMRHDDSENKIYYRCPKCFKEEIEEFKTEEKENE